MTTKTVRIYTTERSNEVVRRVTLWTDHALRGVSSGYFVIRAGVMDQSGHSDFFGEWSTLKQAITAYVPLVITGAGDMNWPLFEGDSAIIEIEEFGSPATISGLSVEFKFRSVGAVQEVPIDRTDLNAPPSREVAKPAFSASTVLADAEVQSAFDELYTDLNGSSVTEWVQTLLIPELFA